MNSGLRGDGHDRSNHDCPASQKGKPLDVVCVGKVMVDVLFPGLPRLPRLGEEFYTSQYCIDVGGGGAITAVGLARLGRRTALIGAVSEDFFGRFLRETIAKEGVDLSCLATAPPTSTPLSIEFSFPSDRATITCTPPCDDVANQPHARECVVRSRHLHISGLTSARVRLLELAVSRGLTTSLDTNLTSETQQELLQHAARYIDVLMPNQSEVGASDETVASIAKDLGSGVRRFAVIKRGSRGAIASDGDTLTWAGAFPVDAMDTTGAGDTFNAGFLCAFLQGSTLEACLSLGNGAGALGAMTIGGVAGTPTLAQVREFMVDCGSEFPLRE